MRISAFVSLVVYNKPKEDVSAVLKSDLEYLLNSAKPKLTHSCSDCYCIPVMLVLLYADYVFLLLNE